MRAAEWALRHARPGLALLAALILLAGLRLLADRRDGAHWGLAYEANGGAALLVERGSAADAAGLRPGEALIAFGLAPKLGPPPAGWNGLLPLSIRAGGATGVRWLREPPPGVPPAAALAWLAAAALWLAGAAVGAAGLGGIPGRSFALFALPGALALACAAAQDAGAGPDWALWALAPAAFLSLLAYCGLQRALLGPLPGLCWPRAEALLAGQAALMVLALLALPGLLSSGLGRPLAALAGLDLALLLVAAHALGAARLAGQPSAPLRRRALLGLTVGLACWLPALALGLLPPVAALLGAGYVAPVSPYAGALGLLLAAAAFPAIVARGDLYPLERAVRRLGATAVVGGALLGVAAALFWVADRLLRWPAEGRLALAAALGLAALPLFDPGRRRLQAALDRRLDAGQPDYGAALEQLGDALLAAVDEEDVAALLTGQAPGPLGIADIRVWLRGAGLAGGWLLYERGERAGRVQAPPPLAELEGDRPFAPPRSAELPGVALCLPVRLDGTARGLLGLGPRRSQDPYRRAEREALILLGRQVAGALQRLDLFADLRRRNAELARLTARLARAREEERKHLSRELHDDVAQDLVAITRQLRRHQHGTPPEAIWQDLIAQSQESLAAIRRICNDLRPAILDMGLASALHELVERLPRGQGGPRVDLAVLGVERRLDEEREFALYRATQEALANAAKHAEAGAVGVTLIFEAETVAVEVRDDGRGFAAPARLDEIAGDHLGLLGMRERLAGLGGSVRLESQPGAGTLLRAELPARPPAAT